MKNILNRQIQSKPIEEKIEENVFGCGVTAATYRTAVRLLSRVSCLQDIGERKKRQTDHVQDPWWWD